MSDALQLGFEITLGWTVFSLLCAGAWIALVGTMRSKIGNWRALEEYGSSVVGVIRGEAATSEAATYDARPRAAGLCSAYADLRSATALLVNPPVSTYASKPRSTRM
jgi:hypothetical protein